MKNKKIKVRKCTTASKVGKVKWKKTLYENADYPDNYTDESFLEELQKNVHFHEVSFLDAVTSAGLVTRELCPIVIFAIIYTYLYNGWAEPLTVFVYSSLFTAIGYLFYLILSCKEKSYIKIIANDINTAGMVLVFGYVLSPVLKTLTDTISTDTIYAMCSFMMAIHLIFFDYGVSAAIVSRALSLNAALFGSLCLASRLSSPFHAFVLLTNAVECFILLPALLTFNRNSITNTVLIAINTALIVDNVSHTLTAVFVFVVVFINLVCPFLFVRYQHYKENIYGPWDEAVIPETDV